jgi:MinD superfamily P-loop ATPase
MGRPKNSKNGIRVLISIKCKTCGVIFKVKPYRKSTAHFCSHECHSESQVFTKEHNPKWNNGRCSANGYIMILCPEHPFANRRGYIYEHRLVMEQYFGRYLLQEEIVHHINGIKTDNRIENLKLFLTTAHHTKLHNNPRDEKTGRFI